MASATIPSSAAVRPAHATSILPFGGGAHIVVPASIGLMTPYVLLEQQDWFEDEIHFVRTFIRPGMTVVDIGANYGVYTLSMARCMRGHGRAVVFEPTASVASALRESLVLNSMGLVELRQCALSDRCGEAVFYVQDNAELNSLHASAGGGRAEKVRLSTLDEEFPASFGGIDFIKLDAEGEEIPILAGGTGFWSRQSPLVMYELKHGNAVNLPLIGKFNALGFDNYRLMPGLGVLVPCDLAERLDGYQLNLFACRADKAGELEAAGLLLRQFPDADAALAGAPVQGAYARHCARFEGMAMWAKNTDAPESPDADPLYHHALDLYALSCCENSPSAARAAALIQADSIFGALAAAAGQASVYGLMRVRAALDLGARSDAVAGLSILLREFDAWARPELACKPLFPASRRFDGLSTQGNPRQWLLASLAEQLELARAFSSYFTGAATLGNLRQFPSFGFDSPALARRLQLVERQVAGANAIAP